MLEGPKNSVLGLYDIIVGDSRHVGVNVLEQNPIESRVYPEFGMALARTTQPSQLAAISTSQQYSQHLVRIQYSSTLLAPNIDAARLLLRDILEVAVTPAGGKEAAGAGPRFPPLPPCSPRNLLVVG